MSQRVLFTVHLALVTGSLAPVSLFIATRPVCKVKVRIRVRIRGKG